MPYSKSFDETYTMRSTFFQILGKAGKLLAEAYTVADRENQDGIARLAFGAMRHALVELHGYPEAQIANSPTPCWNTDMQAMPTGRPVMLRMTTAPIGWNVGGATVTFGQRGDRTPGVWTQDGFFEDKPKKGTPGSDIFVAWAEVPTFDGAA